MVRVRLRTDKGILSSSIPRIVFKNILPLVASVFSVLILIASSAQAQWENKTTAPLTDDSIPNAVTKHPLHIDKEGRLYVGYMQVSTATDPRIYYTVFDTGTGWSQPTEVVYDTSYKNLISVNMAINNDSSRWIAFGCLKWMQGEYVVVYRVSAETLTVWEIDSIYSVYNGQGLDMDVDANGNIHVIWYRVFWDSLGNWKKNLMYAVYHDGIWDKQPVGDTTAYSGGNLLVPFLSVTEDGRAYIATYVRKYFYPQYDLMRNNILAGTSWERMDSISAPYYFNVMGGMEIDKDENLHVLLNGYDVNPGGDKFNIYYYKRDNSTGQWVIQDLLTDEGKPLSFFVDSLNEPHAAWTHWSGDFPTDNVIYANKKSGIWQSSELLRYDEFYPYTFDFLIDSEGRGHGIFTGYGSAAGWGNNDSVEIYYIHSNPLDIDQPPVIVPKTYEILASYPNPFNSSVKIEYYLQGRSEVSLRIYNVLGKEVRNLVGEKVMTAGRHLISWDGKDDNGVVLASGVYFCFLEAGQQKYTRKVVLIR